MHALILVWLDGVPLSQKVFGQVNKIYWRKNTPFIDPCHQRKVRFTDPVNDCVIDGQKQRLSWELCP